MRVGVSIAPGEAALAKNCGFDYVELAGKHVQRMGQRVFDALRWELDRARIPCLGFNAYCPGDLVIAGEGADPVRAAAYARKLLPRAQALGVHTVGIGSPFSRILPEHYAPEQAFQQTVDFFRATGEVFGLAGIRVCVEALGQCYCNWINRVDEALQIARAAALSNVGVVVDFYNMEHEGEADRCFLQEELPWIFHAHISDDDGTPQQRSFLKPEKAGMHIERVQKLAESGYDGDITLEIDLPLDSPRAIGSLAILRQAAK